MSEELKPCPFCGSSARYEWDNEGTHKCLGCPDEDCAGYILFDIWYKDVGTKHEADAIEAWNRRASHDT